jgi:hypothetical protein
MKNRKLFRFLTFRAFSGFFHLSLKGKHYPKDSASLLVRSTKWLSMYSGFVLFCNKTEQEQCLREKQYACAGKKPALTTRIKVGSLIFLYNVDSKSLLGPFTALSEGGETVDTGAWMMEVDEHSASENVKLEWEELHRLENASAQLPFLEAPKTCELSTTQTQRILDLLKQAPVYIQGKGKKP